MLALTLLLSCMTAECPAGATRDTALEAQLIARLAVEDLPRPELMCFRAGAEPLLTAGDVLLLDPGWGEAANTARAAHLMLHRRQGLTPEADCGRWKQAEGEARSLEARLRVRAGLPAPAPPPLDSPPASCDAAFGGTP